MIKAKYVTGENREAAEAKAEEFLGVGRNGITFDVISGAEEGAGLWNLLAIEGTGIVVANMNAAYGVYYEEDGVYLELYPERGGGRALNRQDLAQHINRKNINGIMAAAMQSIADAGSGRAKIAPAQQELFYGEDLTVEISNDEMEARARLLAGEPGGVVLNVETATQRLLAAGVTQGIDEVALKDFLDAKDYNEPGVVAVALQPEDGEDGKLVFNFSKDERTGRPREIGGGRVDYRSLDLYEPVTEGQLLVTRIPATEGSPGMTVKGREIKQRPGKEVIFPRGKNVNVNAEKTEMHATVSGMVQFLNNSVNVSNLYKINGDCDLTVGNIDFDGSVHISGSVRSGHTVKATGGIVIGGTVEAATLIAGGNIEIKSGMQGADKGRIEAGGSITALYIERGTAIADGPITLDVSIHSLVESGGTLTAKGKRGAIIGGHAGAAADIIANFIGAVSNTQTEVVVGVTQRKRERIQYLEKELERIANEQVKLDQLDAYLEKSKDKMDPEMWNKLFRSGVENRRINEDNIEGYTFEVKDLKYELEHATEGRVHVLDTIYHGSRILIGSDMYRVREDISYATFRFKDGQIVFGPCDLSKSK